MNSQLIQLLYNDGYCYHDFVQGFSIILNQPVPQPSNHESKEWYHAHTDRSKAEELLRWIPRDGAFLLRPSDRESNSFSISFRSIHHTYNSEQFQSSFRAVSEQFQSSFRAVLEQFFFLR